MTNRMLAGALVPPRFTFCLRGLVLRRVFNKVKDRKHVTMKDANKTQPSFILRENVLLNRIEPEYIP